MINLKALILLLSTLLFLGLMINSLRNNYYTKPTDSLKKKYLEYSKSIIQSTVQPTVRPTPIILPDWTKESIKPRNIFDLTKWKLYEYPKVGLRFKYPPQWGNPETVFQRGDTGWYFQIHFTNNSLFKVGGTSKDFSAGRSSDWTDFNGFGNRRLFGISTQNICEGQLFCQKNGLNVHVVTNVHQEDCLGMPGYMFKRLMFLDRPNNIISGLAFGGGFIFPEYPEDLICSGSERTIQSFRQAILDRRLNGESMINFDLYEKVFETVEAY